MEIEEGVHVTEQVIELLDQFIRQGKELHILDNTAASTSLEHHQQQQQQQNQQIEDEFVGYGKTRSLEHQNHLQLFKISNTEVGFEEL